MPGPPQLLVRAAQPRRSRQDLAVARGQAPRAPCTGCLRPSCKDGAPATATGVRRRLTEAEARDVVEEVRAERQEASGHRDSLDSAMRLLSLELNARRCHFLYELVQNADDNDYAEGVEPTLLIELTGDGLHIQNNELGFTPEDVRAMCNVGASSKRRQLDRIGYKGVGFKSVFRYCASPYVCSGGFSFRLGAQGAPGAGPGPAADGTGLRGLALITPEWVDPSQYPVERDPRFGTSIFLPAPPDLELASALREQMCPELLLFLRRLRVVELRDSGGWVRLRRLAGERAVVRVEQCTLMGESPTADYAYRVLRRQVHLHTAKPAAKAQAQASPAEIAVAFQLDPETGRPRPQRGCQAFSYLPVCESGLRFILHGDFELTAGRDALLEASDRNAALCRAAAQLFVDAVAEAGPQADWLALLPLSGEVSAAALRPLAVCVPRLLSCVPCIPVLGQQRCEVPSKVLLCSAAFSELFDPAWVRAATGVQPVGQQADVALHRPTLEVLGCRMDVVAAVRTCLEDDERLAGKPPDFFARLYRYLASEHVGGWEAMRDLSILPLRRCGGRVSPASGSPGDWIYMADEQAVPLADPLADELPSEVRLLDPGVTAHLPVNSLGRTFLLALNVRAASPTNILGEVILPRYARPLTASDEDVVLGHLRYLQRVLGFDDGGRTSPSTSARVDEGMLARCRQELRVLARQRPGCGGTPAEWRRVDECYLESEGLLELLDGVEGVWFVSPRVFEAGVSRRLLQCLGAHATPRLVTLAHEVPWTAKDKLVRELAMHLGPTHGHYVVQAPDFAPEVAAAAARPDRAAHLLRLLDRSWGEVQSELRSVTVAAFHRGPYPCDLHGSSPCVDLRCATLCHATPPPHSPLLHTFAKLRALTVRASDGEARPLQTCYWRSDSLQGFFGEDLPYLDFQLSSHEFRAALAVPDALTAEVALARLRQLAPCSSAPTALVPATMRVADLRAVLRIYMYLGFLCWRPESREAVRKAFDEHPLIVTAAQPVDKLRCDETAVVWSRARDSRWQGDGALYRGRLALLHGFHGDDAERRQFFVGCAGVPARTSAEDALEALRTIAEKGSPPAPQDAATARRLTLELARELRGPSLSKAETGRVELLGRQRLFLTSAGSFVRAGDGPLVPDDAELLAKLADQVGASERLLDVDPRSAAELRPLAAFFGLPLLSARVRRAVPESCRRDVRPQEEWTRRLRRGAYYCAQLAHDAAPDILEGPGGEKVVAWWCRLRQELQCVVVTGLAVEQQVEGLDLPPSIVPCDVFGDASGPRIFVDRAFMERVGRRSARFEVSAEAAAFFAADLPAHSRDAFLQRAHLLLAAPEADMLRLLERGTLKGTRPLPRGVADRLFPVVPPAPAGAAAPSSGSRLDPSAPAWTPPAAFHCGRADEQATAGAAPPAPAVGQAGPAAGGAAQLSRRPGADRPGRPAAGSGAPAAGDDSHGAWWAQGSESRAAAAAGPWELEAVAGPWEVQAAGLEERAAAEEGAAAAKEQEEEEGYETPKLLARMLNAVWSDEGCASVAQAWAPEAPLDMWPSASSSGTPCRGAQPPGSALARGRGSPPPAGALREATHNARKALWRESVKASIEMVTQIYKEQSGPAILSGRASRHLREAEEWAEVADLRYSHHRISPRFSMGPHRGRELSTLVDALRSGEVQPCDILLRGVRYCGRVHTLNNRRLYALKEYAKVRGGPVFVRVLVYEPCPVTAKFILGYSTVDEGLGVEVGLDT